MQEVALLVYQVEHKGVELLLQRDKFKLQTL